MASWINNSKGRVIYLQSNVYALRYRYSKKRSSYADKEKLLLLNKPCYTTAFLVMHMRVFLYLYCHFRSRSVCYLIDVTINYYYLMKFPAIREYYQEIINSGRTTESF